MSFRTVASCLAGLVVCFGGRSLAQVHTPTVAAPAELLASLGLVGGTIQALAIPLEPGPCRLQLNLDGVTRTLWLLPNETRSPNFRLLLDDGKNLHQLPTSPSTTYRGDLSGLPDAQVAASIAVGQLWATIHLGSAETYGVEPLAARFPGMPREAHIVFRSTDRVRADVHCGVDAHADLPPIHAPPGPAALRVAEIAIDADLAFLNRHNNDPTAVERAVTGVINSCNVIYRRDCEIEFVITAIIVRTTNVYSWTGDLCNLLSQFRTRWNNNHRSITRDLAHLFTGEGSFSGVIGCANVGVVCTTSAYGASKAYGDLLTNVGLVSHEIGHNWNAPHCDSQATCNIMCSGLGGCSGNISAFEPYSASVIVAHKNSRTCLSNPTAPVVTAITPSSVASWAPPPVTLTGTGLETVTSLTVAGVAVNFVVNSPTSITFTPRAPFFVATHPVVASNTTGSSAPVNLTVTGNDPPVVELSTFLLRNFPMPLVLHSNPGWVGLPLLSFSNTPSFASGLVSLGIGSNFTDLLQLGFLVAGGNGSAVASLSLPPDTPPALVLFTQLIAFDPTNLTLPLAVSNVVRSEVR